MQLKEGKYTKNQSSVLDNQFKENPFIIASIKTINAYALARLPCFVLYSFLATSKSSYS